MKRTESASSAQVLKPTQPKEFDLVILGGGTGSTIAAWTFAGEGKRVAVVERRYIGGSCPNIACLPSKNVIHSAKVASYFRRSQEFGITHDGTDPSLQVFLSRPVFANIRNDTVIKNMSLRTRW